MFRRASALLQSLRVARMEFLIRAGHRLAELVPSRFTREWLHQVLLSVLTVQSQARSIEETLGGLSDDRLRTLMLDAAREVFGVLAIGDSEGGDSHADDTNLIIEIAAALDVAGV